MFSCKYIYIHIYIYTYTGRRVLLQGVIFDIGLFGLVETSANLGAGAFFRVKKAISKRKKDVKNRVPKTDVFKKECLGLQNREPDPTRDAKPRTPGLQNREGAFQQKEAPLPEARKRRCLKRCCSLRNHKVQKVKQKQIRRDARQEADMTRSEAHRKQANTKKPHFP